MIEEETYFEIFSAAMFVRNIAVLKICKYVCHIKFEEQYLPGPPSLNDWFSEFESHLVIGIRSG